MTIPTLPSAPLVTDIPADFNTKAFNWVAALDNWTTEANATGVAADADAATATSAAGTATTQAGTATTQAGIATSAASTATTQAGIATTKAGEANASAVAAAASAASINLNSIDINGGTIDGTVIGGTTPAAVSATTLSASNTLNLTGDETYTNLYSSAVVGQNARARFRAVGSNAGSGYGGSFQIDARNGSNVWGTVADFSSTGLEVTGALSATGNVSTSAGTVTGLTTTATNGTISVSSTNDTTNGVVGTFSNHPLAFYVNSSKQATLDTSGNLGLGVTPSAWSASARAFQFGSLGMLFLNASGYPELAFNTYQNTSNSYTYKNTDVATRYIQSNGTHSWYTAPSGTAGNAITFTQVLAVEKDKSLALQGATPAAGCGIAFPATQVASSNANTLDDYEEGTWTPTQGAGLVVVGGFSSAGTYTKVGRQVTAYGQVMGATSVTAVAGTVMCGGLPFTAALQYQGAGANSSGAGGFVVAVAGTNVYSVDASLTSPTQCFSVTYTV